MENLSLREIFGIGALAFGMFFYVSGVFGFIRFPDVFSRIHAAGKVSVLGIFGFIAALVLLMPESAFHALVLGFLMFIVQPAASHAISQAAYRSGVRMVRPVRDDLQGNIALHEELVDEENRRAESVQEAAPE